MTETSRVYGVAARISMKKGPGDEFAVTGQTGTAAGDAKRLGWVPGTTPGSPHDPRDLSRGYWPPAHYVDNDVRISRGHPKGSEFHRILADLQTGAINSVVATTGDRLWRNRLETAQTLDLFEDLNVWVAVNGSAYNCRVPEHVAMLEQLGVFARLETRRMGVRIDGAAYRRALAGKIDNGPVPPGNKAAWSDGTPRKFLGWQRDDEPRNRMLVAIKEVQQGVLSQAEIARRLNADGFLTSRGNEWTGDTLRQYLLSPWVRGVVTYTGAVPEGEPPFPPDGVPGTNFEALVPDPEEYALLRLALGTGPDKGGHHKRDDPQHLLAGFARCGRVLDASDSRGECGECGHHPTLARGGKLSSHSPASGGWNSPQDGRCPGSGQTPLRTFPHERAGEVCGAALTTRRGTSNGQPVYCCPAWPRGCGKLARNEAALDTWVYVNLLHWLSGPDGAYDRSVTIEHAEDPAVSQLQGKQAEDKARLARIDAEWSDTDGKAYGHDINRKIAEEERIEARIKDRQAIIDRKATRQRAAVVTERGHELAEAWSGKWGLEKKRAVLGMFIDHVQVLPCRQGPIPFDPSKVIVVPLATWAEDAPWDTLMTPVGKMDVRDPRKGRKRNPVPDQDRILRWLRDNPGADLTAIDVMARGLADTRDIKAANQLLWRMEKAAELSVTVPGVRGHSAPHYGLPAKP